METSVPCAPGPHCRASALSPSEHPMRVMRPGPHPGGPSTRGVGITTTRTTVVASAGRRAGRKCMEEREAALAAPISASLSSVRWKVPPPALTEPPLDRLSPPPIRAARIPAQRGATPIAGWASKSRNERTNPVQLTAHSAEHRIRRAGQRAPAGDADQLEATSKFGADEWTAAVAMACAHATVRGTRAELVRFQMPDGTDLGAIAS